MEKKIYASESKRPRLDSGLGDSTSHPSTSTVDMLQFNDDRFDAILTQQDVNGI